MARSNKTIITNGIDRRHTGYYSTPAFVAEYLREQMLSLNPSPTKILDPAVGKEELIENYSQDCYVDGYDIIQHKPIYNHCNFIHKDFIDEYIVDHNKLRDACYDFIIMNPPYNNNEHTYISQNKLLLKEHFDIGVSNLFALFLSASIDIAKDGCVIGAIVPDSIFYASIYERLRQKIVNKCAILQIILCPECLFRKQRANVATCLMILTKGDVCSEILTANRCETMSEFQTILAEKRLLPRSIDDILLNIGNNTVFAIDVPIKIKKIISACPKLGDTYQCGGGISTGNDKLFTSSTYAPGFTIPFFKNPASSKFIATPNSYLCDDFMTRRKGVHTFILRNKAMLHHEGIVCSSLGKQFSAAYLPAEGVSGINATIWPPTEEIDWLLAYLNSSFVTYLIKGVISRGIMTTIGNVSSLPVVDFSDSKKRALAQISQDARNRKISVKDAVARIDTIIYRHLAFSEKEIATINHFCADLTHLV